MECSKGSTCTESTHKVTTISKAQEWLSSANVTDLPIRIEQRKSAGGRLFISIFNNNGALIGRRG